MCTWYTVCIHMSMCMYIYSNVYWYVVSVASVRSIDYYKTETI